MIDFQAAPLNLDRAVDGADRALKVAPLRAGGSKTASGPKPRSDAATVQSLRLGTLLQHIARGDRAAFGALYRDSSSSLAGVARNVLNRHDLAEEVLQEAFLVVWEKAGKFDPDKGEPMAWLAAIVKNKCRDHLRVERRHIPQAAVPATDPVDPSPSPFDLLARSRDAQIVLRGLAQLGPARHEVIHGVFFEELTHTQIAARTGIPLGTIKRRIYSSLAKLKTSIRI